MVVIGVLDVGLVTMESKLEKVPYEKVLKREYR